MGSWEAVIVIREKAVAAEAPSPASCYRRICHATIVREAPRTVGSRDSNVTHLQGRCMSGIEKFPCFKEIMTIV